MEVKDIINRAREWYTMGRYYVPTFPSMKFIKFASQSTHLAYAVVEEGGRERYRSSEPISVQLTTKVSSAYVDIDKKTIYISENYFNPDFYEKRFGKEYKKDFGLLALSAINGSTVHEALHLKWTEFNDIKRAIERSDDGTQVLKDYGSLATGALNLVEDLFIESKTPIKLRRWIDGKNDIFFSSDFLDEMLVKHEDEETITDAFDGLNIVTAYKNRSLRDHPVYDRLPSRVFEIIKEVAVTPKTKRPPTTHERIRLAIELINNFDKPEIPPSEYGFMGIDGDGEAGEEIDALMPSVRKLSEEEGEVIKRALESEVEKIVEEYSPHKTEVTPSGVVHFRDLKEYDVMDYPQLDDRANPTTSIDFSFLREIQAIRTVNHTPGQARPRGARLVGTRLSRIATDGKIFANHDSQKRNEQRIEIIILIDFSGSTHGRIINNELGSAMEITKVLKSARIPFSVYGHTSVDNYGDQYPSLFLIESYGMKTTTSNNPSRWERAFHVSLKENFDGLAIREVATKFTGKPAAKYIINLSDGSPQAPGYSGIPAQEHTRNEIWKARKNGIAVFSISVINGVEKMNDSIYGTEWNIKADGNLSLQFRNLIAKIVR